MNLINKIYIFLQDIINITKFENLNGSFKKNVFYSESINYDKYFYEIIFQLNNTNKRVTYITSDNNSIYNNFNNVKIIKISKGFLLNIFLSSISCYNLIMTMSDLGNTKILKSKNCHKYYYIFHSLNSTHCAYNDGAFDNFDKIFCNGQYQIEEIRNREKIKKLNEKILVKSGYLYLNYLKKFINNSPKKKHIVFAPSWSFNQNLFDEYGEKIIKELIKEFNVTLRTHPEHLKRSQKTIFNLQQIAKNSNSFSINNDINCFNEIENSELLITDGSGVGLEYMLAFKKPVIFINEFKKIHNTNFNLIKNDIFEHKFQKKFGVNIDKLEIKYLNSIVSDTIIKKKINKIEIEKFENNNFFKDIDIDKLVIEHFS